MKLLQKLKWNKNFSGNIYRNCLRCKNSKLFYYLPSQPIFWRRFWHDQTINRLQPYFWGLKKCHENFNLFGKMILVLLIKLKKFSYLKVIFHIFCQWSDHFLINFNRLWYYLSLVEFLSCNYTTTLLVFWWHNRFFLVIWLIMRKS